MGDVGAAAIVTVFEIGAAMIRPFEKRFGTYLDLMADLIRSTFLFLRGARFGRRVRFGRHSKIQRPWCLMVGSNSHFEHQVHIKATDDKTEIEIGESVFVGFNCEFDISSKLTVGNHCLIAPGCFITDHNHLHAANKLISEQGCETAAVVIEDDVWLGAHVVVLPGVTIGRGAIVAAGAVVNRDVESMSIVAGVPARKIGQRA